MSNKTKKIAETGEARPFEAQVIQRSGIISWEKDDRGNRLGYAGDYHLFTFVEDRMGGTLLAQFYGYTPETPSEFNCPGGFTEAQEKAPELLHDFLWNVMGCKDETFNEFWQEKEEHFLRCSPRCIAINCSLDGMGRAWKHLKRIITEAV